MSKAVNNEKFQDKCSWPHDLHFTESHKKYLVAHSADVQGNVVADHGVDHKESHHQSENNVLKFSFWHKIVLLFLKNKYKKDTCVVRYQAYTCVVSNFIPELICY